MSIKSKFKTFFFLDDEYDDSEEEHMKRNMKQERTAKIIATHTKA